MIKINETPVRTSRNFNINNIKLDGFTIPKKIGKFNTNNINIIGDDISCSNSNDNNNYNNNLIYGLGKEFEDQVINDSNSRLLVKIDNSNNDTNKVKDQTRMINYMLDKDNNNLVDSIRIVANKDTNSTIIIKYESEDNIECYHNGIIYAEAFENAKIDIIIINMINDMSRNFISIQNNLAANSKINYTIVDLGGKTSITNYYSNLEGQYSDNQINGIYLGKENQLFDLNYIAELRGEKSNVNIDVQGALKDEAVKHFKGTIDFKTGCKKAKGNENESCMLLSDKAKSLALPMLLCSEEDVEGNHSTSSGKAQNKELFYIMTRGFTQKEALKLLVRAKFNGIIETIKDEELKEQILNVIDKRLD